jgi:hypothetical protein
MALFFENIFSFQNPTHTFLKTLTNSSLFNTQNTFQKPKHILLIKNEKTQHTIQKTFHTLYEYFEKSSA